MGNVLREDLAAIWNGARFDAFRRRMFPTIGCACIDGCDPSNVIADA
jgi:hypothetical protein